MGESGPTITCENVGLALGGVEILRDVNVGIRSGEVHCIIGPNGGGKTSFVRCLLGEMPHTGRVAIEWGANTTTGYVPQYLDFDRTLPVSVNDFMAMVTNRFRPAFFGIGKSSRTRSDVALQRVGLNGKRKTRLGSLSGGERQRVLFAQALVPEPALLVLDEPMTSLDEVGSDIFVRVIKELAASGVTVIWIAHDLSQVREVADCVTCIRQTVLFSGAPADVLGDATAEELFRQSPQHVRETVAADAEGGSE